ncbi:MAG: hypothetical protein FWH46_04715 [Methanimicrococcus sp.]|nr:hypothetical protein [Methanimicrococcus sp.]
MIFVLLLSLSGASAADGPEDILMENVYVFEDHVAVVTNYDLSDYNIYKSNFVAFMEHFSTNEAYTSEYVDNVENIVAIDHSDSAFSLTLSNYYDCLIMVPQSDEDDENGPGLRMILFENRSDNNVNLFYQPVIGWAKNGDFISYYSQAYTNSFYPQILREMRGENAVYIFENYHLRSYYWFPKNVDLSQPLPNENEIFTEYGIAFDINTLDTPQSFTIKSIHICGEHFDSFLDENKTINPSDANSNYCEHHKNNWRAEIGSSTVTNVFGSNPSDHFKSIDSSKLIDDLKNSQELPLKFYPLNREDYAETFMFNNLNFGEYAFKIVLPNGDEDIVVPILLPENSLSGVSSLTSMIFPKEFIEDSGTSVLKDISVVIKEKSADEFSELFDSMSDDVQLYIVDINFSSDKTSDINQFMSENNLVVSLAFNIPLTDEKGNPTRIEDIVIYHIVHDDDTGQDQLVPLTIISNEVNNDFIVVTAQTTGFSPFATTVTPQIPPSPKKSSSSSIGRAVIIDNNNTTTGNDTPSSSKNDTNISIATPPIVVTPPLQDLKEVDFIETIRGNLSIFSIFVVLMSGIFMWNYIRRNL